MPCRHKKSLNVTALFSLGKWPIILITENQVSRPHYIRFQAACQNNLVRGPRHSTSVEIRKGPATLADASHGTVQKWNTLPARQKTRETSTRAQRVPIFI